MAFTDSKQIGADAHAIAQYMDRHIQNLRNMVKLFNGNMALSSFQSAYEGNESYGKRLYWWKRLICISSRSCPISDYRMKWLADTESVCLIQHGRSNYEK